MLPHISPGRLYRTGDLARMLPDGNIEFHGRADSQVKLRGHRIELLEIEAALERQDGVRQAVVVLREDRESDQRLVAYLVAESAMPVNWQQMRAALGESLPDAMIPSGFVLLPAMPLTANGKIDRTALLALPAPGRAEALAANAASAQPMGHVEKIVSAAWQDALGIAAVGQDENFFDLGAHSLTVAEVRGRLEGALGHQVPLLDLFQYTTVRTLAAHLSGIVLTKNASPLADRAERRRLARQR
jgi:acyl carrier protein